LTTFQVERVEVWESECEKLVYEHWQELGLDLDLEIAPNFEAMKQLESMGMFKVITVREDGRMVGYLLAVINTHLHYRTSPKMFIVDAYWISPECRNGTGVKLFKYVEEVAKSLDCIKIYASFKIHKNHSRFFELLGYGQSDIAVTKRI
jgi:N-acetylglutamate synthase-like GNAT family acetyltransferase